MTISPVGVLPFRVRLALLILGIGVAAAWLVRRTHAATSLRPPAVIRAFRPLRSDCRCGRTASLIVQRPAIAELQPFHYRIFRGAFQLLLQNEARWHGAPYRFVPAVSDGVPLGVKLYAIHPGSLIARLGFKNGDLVERMSGLELTSADHALAVYARLRGAHRVRVDLVRRGVPLQLIYEIVD